MPNIALPPYSSIVQSIPVHAHTIKVNIDIWTELIPLTGLSHPILSGQTSYAISRKRLFRHSYSAVEEKCLEILMWGYSSGGRGTNIRAALSNLPAIAVAASTKTLTWQAFFAGFNHTSGVGISAVTKFAYFFGHKFSGLDALILDSRIADILNFGTWIGAPSPVGSYQQWSRNYSIYLQEMQNAAMSIKAKPDQVELFLYLMGRHFL